MNKLQTQALVTCSNSTVKKLQNNVLYVFWYVMLSLWSTLDYFNNSTQQTITFLKSTLGTLKRGKYVEICLKSTTKTPERRQWRHSGVFIVNFDEHISHFFLAFLLLTYQLFLLMSYCYWLLLLGIWCFYY